MALFIFKEERTLKDQSAKHFLNKSVTLNSNAVEKLHVKQEALNGLVRFFRSSEYISENEFKTFCSEILKRFEIKKICYFDSKNTFSVTEPGYTCNNSTPSDEIYLDESNGILTLNKEARSSNGQLGRLSLSFNVAQLFRDRDKNLKVEIKKNKDVTSKSVGHYTNSIPFIKDKFYAHYQAPKKSFIIPFNKYQFVFILFIVLLHLIIIYIFEINSRTEKIIREKVQAQTSYIKEQQGILAESARLSSLGEMAGGIAHEINNPLGIIANMVSLIKKKSQRGLLSDKDIINNLAIIDETVKRISHIIQSMKNLSHHNSSFENERLNCSFDEIIDDVLTICKERFRINDIEIRFQEKSIPYMICCNRIQISQVFINLLNNAFDAVSLQEEGEKKWIQVDYELHEENFLIKFIDSGTGISKENASKIFDPFFSSKEIGKGTGIGLSLSMNIIRSHGGILILDSSHQHTCFTLSFPKSMITT